MVESGEQTAEVVSGVPKTIRKENSIPLANIVLRPAPSNKDLVSNQDLFDTHIEEIDRDLNYCPNTTMSNPKGIVAYGDDNDNRSLMNMVENIDIRIAGRVQDREVHSVEVVDPSFVGLCGA